VTDEELQDALDGLYAYDRGSRDSGVHDEKLRARCIEHMKQWPYTSSELLPHREVSRLVRELWLTDEDIEQGYGLEDVARFTAWLCDMMGWGELIWD
jgi:hypothetical protein